MIEYFTHGIFVAPRPALSGGDETSSGKAAAATEPSASARYGPDDHVLCASARRSSSSEGKGAVRRHWTELAGTSGVVGDALA